MRMASCLVSNSVELDAGGGLDRRDALEALEEIEMPPGAAELAVGGELQSDLFLLLDDPFDLAVLDRFESRGVDVAFGALGTRLLQRRGAQQTADVVGAEGRRCALGHGISLPT